MRETEAWKQQEEEFQFKDILSQIWAGRFLIIAIVTFSFIVTTINVMFQPRIYKANALIYIQAYTQQPIQGYNPLSGGNSYVDQTMYFSSQQKIITSRSVVAKTIEKFNLSNIPPFKGSGDPIAVFQSMVSVDQIKDSALFRISVEGQYKDHVAEWANDLASTYAQENIDDAARYLSIANKIMLEQVSKMQTEFERENKQVYSILKEENAYIPSNQKDVSDEQIKQMELQIGQDRVTKNEKAAILAEAQKVRQSGAPLTHVQAIAKDEVIQDLSRQLNLVERELKQLSVKFTQSYPDVRKKQKEKESLEERIKMQSESILSAIQNEYNTYANQEARLESDLMRLKNEAMSISEKAGRIGIYESGAQSVKKYMDIVYEKIRELNISSSLLNNNIRVVEEAIPPKVPIRPKRLMSILMSIAGGLMVGIGLVFVLQYVDNTIKSSDDIEKKLGMNFLTMIPSYSRESEHSVKESFQTLRTSLIFASQNKQLNTILITSPCPKEGKTSTAVNLANILASTGDKVVIVDCDLRRPSVHKFVRLSNQIGLTNYLAEREADLDNYLLRSSTPNLMILTSGPIPPNPPEIFSMKRFESLIQHLKASYDWVIVDSPPVTSITDAVILANLVDLVVLVLRFRKTERKLVYRALSFLSAANTPIAGAILNDVDIKSSYYYEYYYTSHYYHDSSKLDREGPLAEFIKKRKKKRGA